MKKIRILQLIATIITVSLLSCNKENVTKTLIITGQGDHNWQASSPVLKKILEETGLFSVRIMTAPGKGEDMSNFSPGFSGYKLVVLDYNGDPWTEKTKEAFVNYVQGGGGVVVYHASVNAFSGWKEYAEMTGLRNDENSAPSVSPYIYYSRNEIISDTTTVTGNAEGKAHEYEVRTRITDHPVTMGLPVRWLHAKDELFQKFHGSLAGTKILATAYSDTSFAGTGKHEPALLATTCGKGRIFTTLLGHADQSDMSAMQCAGFIVTLQRGAEWAATGNVTQEVPYDFPDADLVFTRSDYQSMTVENAFENLAGYDIPKSTKYFTFIQDQIRKAGGDKTALLDIERRMVNLLTDPKASAEAKKLILRELSWMGSENCLKAVKEASSDPELRDDAEYALTRLQGK